MISSISKTPGVDFFFRMGHVVASLLQKLQAASQLQALDSYVSTDIVYVQAVP